ncbi:MAG: hypothetical protein JXP73_03950, partial [Deltaproteobacteria bacterium]|nr:hypothetical protein [Deltaproteobacteria bacterium]
MQRAHVGWALAMGLAFGCSSASTTQDGAATIEVGGPDRTVAGDAPPSDRGAATPDASAPPPDASLPGSDASPPVSDAVFPEASDGRGPESGSADSAGAAGPIANDHPQDQGIASDPRVLFHSDFENGLAGWTRYTKNTDQIAVLSDAALANSGTGYLRAQVTRTELASDQYISANAQLDFPRRVPEVYWRFYARFVGQSATPHHWVRVAAGTPSFDSDGLANTVPPGDKGFWFDLDAHKDGLFNFYVYWYKMRSGRCNDGSATPGCAGDQGTTYYYGNNFSPAGQTPFARDTWLCLEIHAKANTVGASDGELALWLDDALVGEYKPGSPRGRWLRDNFFTWGQYFEDVQAFEGFDFRSSDDVLFKRVTLDAYYERGTLPADAPEAQVILYDD